MSRALFDMRTAARVHFWYAVAGLTALAPACRQADVISPPVGQASRAARSGAAAPRCVYRENAFRCCVNPPRELHREAPDVSALPALTGEPLEIIEVRIDPTGRVTESCLLRGVRDDVDRLAMEAVKRWQFEPPRLLADTDLLNGNGRLPAGTAVPVFMTVTMRLGPER